MKCPNYTINNISSTLIANKFIELSFKVKDNYYVNTTVLIVPEFENVKFLLSSESMCLS